MSIPFHSKPRHSCLDTAATQRRCLGLVLSSAQVSINLATNVDIVFLTLLCLYINSSRASNFRMISKSHLVGIYEQTVDKVHKRNTHLHPVLAGATSSTQLQHPQRYPTSSDTYLILVYHIYRALCPRNIPSTQSPS